MRARWAVGPRDGEGDREVEGRPSSSDRDEEASAGADRHVKGSNAMPTRVEGRAVGRIGGVRG